MARYTLLAAMGQEESPAPQHQCGYSPAGAATGDSPGASGQTARAVRRNLSASELAQPFGNPRNQLARVGFDKTKHAAAVKYD
jgi:hypothetical protein